MIAAVNWWGGTISWEGLAFVAIVALSQLVLVAVLAIMQLRSRGRHLRAIREIVVAVEELRSGRATPRPESEIGTSTALALDAIQRLEQELAARSARADKTEDQLRALTDSVKDGAVITTDTDGDIRSFSAGASALLGWEDHEVLGLSLIHISEPTRLKTRSRMPSSA